MRHTCVTELRIHCQKALGCSILGDWRHGGDDSRGRGLFLSAVELSFPHPERGEGEAPLTVTCERPPKFEALLEEEQQQWERADKGYVSE